MLWVWAHRHTLLESLHYMWSVWCCDNVKVGLLELLGCFHILWDVLKLTTWSIKSKMKYATIHPNIFSNFCLCLCIYTSVAVTKVYVFLFCCKTNIFLFLFLISLKLVCHIKGTLHGNECDIRLIFTSKFSLCIHFKLQRMINQP